MYKNFIKNPLEGVTKQLNKEAFTTKAAEKFSHKPFYEKFKQLYIAGKAVIFAAPLFSITTGGTYIYMVLSSQTHFIIALIFSFLAAVSLEVIKSKILNLSFIDLCKNTSSLSGWSLAFIALIFCFSSAYISLQGIQEFEKINHHTESLEIFKTNQLNKDSINSFYAAAILEEKKALEEYKKAVSYMGKIDMSNKANTTTIHLHESNIKDLNKSHKQALKDYKKEVASIAAAKKPDRARSILILVIITLIVEFIIITSSFWVVYFQFTTYLNTHIESIALGLDKELSSINNYNASGSIGFLNKKQENDNTIKDFASIEAAIKAGIRDRRQLTKYGYNIAQVNELLKEFDSKTCK